MDIARTTCFVVSFNETISVIYQCKGDKQRIYIIYISQSRSSALITTVYIIKYNSMTVNQFPIISKYNKHTSQIGQQSMYMQAVYCSSIEQVCCGLQNIYIVIVGQYNILFVDCRMIEYVYCGLQDDGTCTYMQIVERLNMDGLYFKTIAHNMYCILGRYIMHTVGRRYCNSV